MKSILRGAFVVAVLVTLSSTFSFCRRSTASAEPPPETEAQNLLTSYLRIDTTNPPGDETPAAKLLLDFLTKEQIPAKLVGDDPQRQAVYSRLESGTNAPALLLLHHLDVVPANASEWSVPPFAGSRINGYFWGRGALDIKSLGVAELMAFVDLHRRKVALQRDIIFLAVPDEERGGLAGTAALLQRHPELFRNVGFVLNEGGANETIVDHVNYWGIEVDQKIPLWFELTVRDRGGHAAIPPDDGGAAGRMLSLASAIAAIPHPYRLTPTVDRYFKSLAPVKQGRKAQLLGDVASGLTQPDFEQALPASYRGLLRDTCALTQFHAGDSINSLPATAYASFDMRLLPDGDPEAALNEIRSIAAKSAEVNVVLKGEKVPPSPVDTELYRIVAARMKAADRSAAVGPLVTSGTSDSRFFRARGIVAYGISPFKVNYYDADSVHGVDERIRIRFFDEGVRLMRQIVADFATQPRS